MTRLRTVSPQDPGWGRIRCGHGFRYVDEQGDPLPADAVERVRSLAIPPAWTDVWICSHERGHLQAVGVDDAGRKQYLYHPIWREKRDAAKFDRVLAMAEHLPAVRRRLRRQLNGANTSREQVLAAAVRLIDLGCFRIGADTYAEENGSYGLTTLERRHVRRDGDTYLFCFLGKAGVEHEVRVEDQRVRPVLDAITRGRRPSSRLLSAKEGRRWRPLTPAEINDHIRALFGMEVTAKDFRTWHATVTVARALAAAAPPASSKRGRMQQVRSAVTEAADLLGNTPTVARSSYVDPRVIDLFESGRTVEVGRSRSQDTIDRAVVALLSD
jgi:DNA topoisomerase IB